MPEMETPTVDGGKPTVDVETPEATAGDTPEPTKPEAKAPEQEKPKKAKGGFQSRIDKLTREKHEAEQRARDAEERLKASSQPSDAAPKRDDYDSYEEFVKAEARHVAKEEARSALRAEREEAERTKQQAADRELWSTWESRKEAARDKYEDYDEVTNQDIPLTLAMSHALMESDRGPDVAYYLGNHPEEADRISKLSPARQIAEIGKLELKVNQPKKPSAAPEPITPVKPGGGLDNPNPNEKDSDEAWLAKRRKQVYG